MPRWSTVGAESLIRHVLAPAVGLAGFVYETVIHQGEPRWLVISASLTLAVGGPLAKVFDGRGGVPEVPPAPEPPALPPSPTDPTAGRS
jgi:hypothetical protein